MSASGSIEEITLKGRRFPVASDADVSRKLGGSESEVQANGDGSVRVIKKRVPSKLDGVQVAIDDRNGDQEFLQGLADSNDLFETTITLTNGYVYSGMMTITGEIVTSLMNGTATIVLEGSVSLVAQ